MSKKQRTFTDEEKKSIAQKAVSSGDDTVEGLAKEHGVSEKKIRNWIRETGVEAVSEQEEDVSLEATEDFIDSVDYGANFDKLNYRRLIFWSVFGLVVMVAIIQSIKFIHDYTVSSTIQTSSEQSQFYNLDQIERFNREKLESFGVVDPEAGIYRIPIDSAITLIANE